jgi:hypothetical protein
MIDAYLVVFTFLAAILAAGFLRWLREKRFARRMAMLQKFQAQRISLVDRARYPDFLPRQPTKLTPEEREAADWWLDRYKGLQENTARAYSYRVTPGSLTFAHLSPAPKSWDEMPPATPRERDLKDIKAWPDDNAPMIKWEYYANDAADLLSEKTRKILEDIMERGEEALKEDPLGRARQFYRDNLPDQPNADTRFLDQELIDRLREPKKPAPFGNPKMTVRIGDHEIPVKIDPAMADKIAFEPPPWSMSHSVKSEPKIESTYIDPMKFLRDEIPEPGEDEDTDEA